MRKLYVIASTQPPVKDPNAALADVIRDLGKMLIDLQALKDTFVTEFSKPWGAAYVIRWKADDIFETEYKARTFGCVLELWNSDESLLNMSIAKTPAGMIELLKKIKGHVEEELLDNRNRPTSTSPVANAEEISKNAACSRMRREFDSFIGRINSQLEVK